MVYMGNYFKGGSKNKQFIFSSEISPIISYLKKYTGISIMANNEAIFDKITNTNIFFPSIIHPSAIISDIDFVDMGSK